jgi:hypothetical protein
MTLRKRWRVKMKITVKIDICYIRVFTFYNKLVYPFNIIIIKFNENASSGLSVNND